MHVAGVALMSLALVALVLLFSFSLLRTYIDKREASGLTSFISTVAVAITLLCVMLIPVDIYIVSSDLNADGSQSDPDLTHTSAQAIQSVYYALYITLLIFAFMLLPFTYFYYEEDSEESTVSSRTCSALKYMAGFVVFFLVLLALGIVLKKGKQDNTTDWRDKLSNDFTSGEAVLSFSVGCLACFGLSAYVLYAAYGLARMPLKLMSRAKITVGAASSSTGSGGSGNDGARTGLLTAHRRREQIPLSSMSQEDLELSLRRNTENIQYLKSQYDLSGRPWSREDKKQLEDLMREQRRLQSLRQSRLRTGGGGAGGRQVFPGEGPETLSCWDKTWNLLFPFRMVIAIALVLLSLLIVVSLTITVIDKFQNSACGPSCGYALGRTHILNPIDEALKGVAKAFPIDCFFFGGLVMYIFLACVSGVVGLGVRFMVWRLYSIQKGRTLPNAYMLAAWIFQLMTLTLNMQVLTLAPSYATFGNQFYLNTTSGERQACDTDLIGRLDDHRFCVQTQVATFINTMGVETPFFSVILFYGNLFFLGGYLLFLAHGVFCADNSKKEAVDEFQRLGDLSD